MDEPGENVALQVIESRPTRVTLTRYDRMALKFVAELQAMMEQIPYLEPGGSDARRFIKSKAGVPRAFVEDALGRLRSDEQVKTAMGRMGDAALDGRQYVDAFYILRSKLGSMYDTLNWAILYKEAELASAAQKIFGMAKTLAHDANDVVLTHIVSELRHARKRPRRKRKPKPDTEE